MAIVYEEFGRSLAPSPHWASCVLSAKVLNWLELTRNRRLQPGIASGETIVVPAWLEPKNGFGPEGVQMRAVKQGDGYVLNGTKLMVQFAGHANRLLVLARVGEVCGCDRLACGSDSEWCKADTVNAIMQGDALYRVDFNSVAAAADVWVQKISGTHGMK
ncbi:MAG: acyl-CoA/acyl-ACP dehydrogenase [Cellvibrionales bacterium]|nr:acyl-CoA/acyl-ACP dehydrogenase [Cellvibrionales bacterium]